MIQECVLYSDEITPVQLAQQQYEAKKMKVWKKEQRIQEALASLYPQMDARHSMHCMTKEIQAAPVMAGVEMLEELPELLAKTYVRTVTKVHKKICKKALRYWGLR